MNINNYKSLISEIAHKGIISPYEAIHLQYLNHQYVDAQVYDIKQQNPYLAVEQAPEIVSIYQLKELTSFQSELEGIEYDQYQWAANLQFYYDNTVGDIGYKGIALMNELRFSKEEYFKVARFYGDTHATYIKTLCEFMIYSHVHQKIMSFSNIIDSFAFTFRLLIIIIDNILTLNYYLNELVDISKLHCLKYLTMLLKDEEPIPDDEGFIPVIFNPARVSYDIMLETILNQNHAHFVELIHAKTIPGKSDECFEERSLQYVKKVLKNNN